MKELHFTVYDPEEQYPYHIVRYPEFGSVAPRPQVDGVIMGRLVHCQETCTHMKDFKESVATVLRHAMWRGYARRLVQSVWSRFLFQKWHSADVRVKELRVWFAKIWAYLTKCGEKKCPEPTRAVPPILADQCSSDFFNVFRVPSEQLGSAVPQQVLHPQE